MNILDEIVERRGADIARLGYEYGCAVPKERAVAVRSFMAARGAILEVKRASPSRGNISPNLDAAKTALEYAKGGARAISVLTERNYFKGGIDDLMAVRAALDDYAARNGGGAPAVLRKDFLCDVRDIDVAHRAGADAVLLIARILPKERLLEMADKVRSFGMSALIEVRETEDLDKVRFVFSRLGADGFVCGVNSRDLQDFSIDMLVPAKMLSSIREMSSSAKVVFESGIHSPLCAAAVSAMGFDGFLMGEAAAKSPGLVEEYARAFEGTRLSGQGRFWLRIASLLRERQSARGLPLVKICGNTRIQDAMLAAELGADLLGFVFCAKSPRNVDAEFVESARRALRERFGGKSPLLVAVATETDSEEGRAALDLARRGTVDAVQLHCVPPSALGGGRLDVPHYVAATVRSDDDIRKVGEPLKEGEFRVLVDSRLVSALGASGGRVEGRLVSECAKMSRIWLAGGIDPDNVRGTVERFSPEMIDVASGVEAAPGIKDEGKLRALFACAKGE